MAERANTEFNRIVPPMKPYGPMTERWFGDNTVSKEFKE
jgi:hypothetical protein